MTKVIVAQLFVFLLNIISSSLCAKGLDIQVPGAPIASAISLKAMADSMQEYVNIRSIIQREQKKRIPSEDLPQLRNRFKEQSAKVKNFANNCPELENDSRTNILEAIKEDERHYLL